MCVRCSRAGVAATSSSRAPARSTPCGSPAGWWPQALAAVTAAARPGVSTGELDAIAEQVIRDGGGVPSFLGYHGYPASICASLNEQIVHGIPCATQVLADGDLLSVDCGAIVEGWHGDAAVTLAVGDGRGRPTWRCRRRAERRCTPVSRPPARRPAHRHLARRADRRGGRRAPRRLAVRHRRGVRRARHRHVHAHGPVPAQLRRPRAGARGCRGDGAGRRADADGAATRRPASSTTGGRSSRPTAAGRCTGSTRSPSPTTVRGSSPSRWASRPTCGSPSSAPDRTSRPRPRSGERMSMLAELVELVIGVDTHADTHTAALVAVDTRALLATITVAADADGYAQLRGAGRAAWRAAGVGDRGRRRLRRRAGPPPRRRRS